MSSMFRGRKINNTTTPKFKTTKEEIHVKKGIRNDRFYRVRIESRLYDIEDWIPEYVKDFPINYELIDVKIKMIESIIRENYFNFRKKIFDNVVMFSWNYIMFKDPILLHQEKLLSGNVIDNEILSYLPIDKDTVIDIVDNKGGLQFYYKNEAVIYKHPSKLIKVSFYLNGKRYSLDKEDTKDIDINDDDKVRELIRLKFPQLIIDDFIDVSSKINVN